jgi:hypothetical protein
MVHASPIPFAPHPALRATFSRREKETAGMAEDLKG